MGRESFWNVDAVFKICNKPSLPLPIFLANVQAGFPSPAEDYIDQTLNLNELLITHPTATFLVRVSGDSMKDAGIMSGDVLIVDRSIEPTDGKIVVAILNSEFTVKRFCIQGKSISLVPENSAYPSLKIDKESDFQVWGVVTYIIHRAR